MASCRQTIQKRVEFKLDFIFNDPRSTKGTQRITANFRPAATEALNSQMPLIGIPGFVPWQVCLIIAHIILRFYSTFLNCEQFNFGLQNFCNQNSNFPREEL